jgi:hypothetical protein
MKCPIFKWFIFNVSYHYNLASTIGSEIQRGGGETKIIGGKLYSISEFT